jgi:PAS domain S-box-containing protein
VPHDYVQEEKPGPPDFSNVNLSDVIDVCALQEMMNDYYALTGIGIGIIDLKGKVLVGTGWQDVCAKFHRAVPKSCTFCHESDITLSSGVPPGTFKEYRCKNNMWEIVTPIMLGERHIGNIFLGQFLFDDEEPDYELFRAQARRFSYDEAEYLAALDRVPRWSRETVQTAMGFYAKLARMISQANYTNVILADTLARREQAEEALKLTRISVEAASDALFWITPDARIVDVNEAACSSLGYSREELLQLSVPDFDPHFNAGAWPQHFATLQQRGSITFESEHRSKDGRIFPVEIVANHVKFGSELCKFAFVRDITERKRIEKAMRESEERYRRIVETAREGILVSDALAVTTYVNRRMADLLGYCEEEMLGHPLLDFIESQCREEVLAQFERRKEGVKSKYESVMLRKNGEKIWVAISGSPVFDDNGAFAGSFAMISNITARKRAEQELRASELAMRVIFNNAHDAIFIHEINGDIIDVNDKMLEMYGVDRQTALTLSIVDHYSGPDNLLHQVSAIWEKVAAGENQLFEWQARRINDGSLFDVEVSLRRITLHQRHAILATVRDITVRKQAARAIEILNTNLAARAYELEAVNGELEAFNYTVSHDLRAPLSNISTCNQVIDARYSDSLDEECLALIRIIGEQTMRMDQIITTLLNFSSLTHCKMRKEKVNLSCLAQTVVSQLQMNDPQRRVSFVIAEGVEAQGDADLIMRVLENLIGNAWKYTGKQDMVLIEFGVAEKDDAKTYFVRDNGPGFDMEYANKLFLPFQRLPCAKECQGFGIGLATVQRIISRHGGRVWAEGERERGATFYFTLG